jgi:flavin reductase (DIM6/NTAB) family NADH-FMN oxidoreductase RutF
MFEADPSVGHRLLAPRIAYLIGTTGSNGPDLAPISNLTSVSRTPQVLVIAVYKEWQTYANLQEAGGFTVSVPHRAQNDAVWKLGEKYSHFTPPAGQSKLDACGNAIVPKFESGPVLADAIGWLECKIVATSDIESDHGIFFGGVARAFFNDRFLTEDGQYIIDSRPVMQLVGNVFATSGETWTNDYF